MVKSEEEAEIENKYNNLCFFNRACNTSIVFIFPYPNTRLCLFS